ncbi:ribbon-helix-helix protein, CopG family [Planktothrix agardhii]|uniref:ribbon-helix-helix protein, CopG family n=1 Tax=Planktothrix agardhii TaxID=1160 RepID=UPI0005A5E0DA|nr:ribbon-helix-helix protein, CopG family [Planktothrix agardhii 1809]MCB8780187.1 ribbon-helix-helix protein, CopG family [Planktothrix agardhii 1031]MCB8784466.1 ribbon-helix-helix protein, CopG family [Planktothrix agardhii 1808]MCB8784605.1 ribbon-helix-helix protein, CopG family [Planktothrix agardhii 1808]CAD5985120.1 hypothetical protein NIVACYA_04477 [Planktothrix agardhii]
MAPPKKPIDQLHEINLSIKITRSLDQAIELAAREQRLSKSQIIRDSLKNLNLPNTEKTA